MLIKQLIPPSNDQLLIWLKTLSNQLSKGTVIINYQDSNLPILHANDDFLKLTNYKLENLVGQSLTILNGHRTNLDTYQELHHHLKNGLAKEFTLVHYTMDGSAFWHKITIHPIKNEHQTTQLLLLTCEDNTELALNKMLSKLEHEVYEAIDVDHNLQSILSLITKKIEKYYIRDVYCTIHLFDNELTLNSIGSNTLPIEIINELELLKITPNIGFNDSAIYLKEFILTKQQEQLLCTNQLNYLYSSWTKPIIVSQKNMMGILTLFNQDNIELKQADINYLNRLTLLIQLAIKYAIQKNELRRLAFYDVETHLPNAHYFKSKLSQWLTEGKSGFTALIHPTEYNKIVDLYGRNAGSELLSQIVKRMYQLTAPHDFFIARFSNSIIVGTKTDSLDWSIYKLLIDSLTKKPFILNGIENYITLKIGVTTFNQQKTIEQCIHEVDIALSKARKINGTSVAEYEENSNKPLAVEMEIFNQLTYGIQNSEFYVHLQPKINIKTLEVEGFEALSRWHSHVLGNVSPAQFIPIAEKSGKIKEIDLLNFKTILTWLQNLLNQGKKVLPVALNVSPDHFYEPKFLDNIIKLFKQYNVPAKYIKFEVTESIELEDLTKAKEILMKLNELGIESSIDDFGVGYSSLSYLPKLPFSEIKIDRSFINAMNEPGMYAVVQTIIQLAENIHMRAIAEGIETEEQLIMLQELGCPAGQGFYFYKPMSIEEAENLITE
ncbi:MAG: EAL domain-containing protein [Solibacillus sp.]|uniref:EAL domain-containing protein n=1 Tax=unclassified Solibacillus TaxID=2637870 RepID=UPI0030FA7229